jgi:hypothetical protein
MFSLHLNAKKKKRMNKRSFNESGLAAMACSDIFTRKKARKKIAMKKGSLRFLKIK